MKKNRIFVVGMVVVALAATMAFTACSKKEGGSSGSSGGGGAERNAFNGTWVASNGGSFTISANELRLDNTVIDFIMSIDSVTAMTFDNANYPSGFRFDGKYKEVIKGNFDVGKETNYTLRMHTGKKELMWNTFGPYKKQ